MSLLLTIVHYLVLIIHDMVIILKIKKRFTVNSVCGTIGFVFRACQGKLF